MFTRTLSGFNISKEQSNKQDRSLPFILTFLRIWIYDISKRQVGYLER